MDLRLFVILETLSSCGIFVGVGDRKANEDTGIYPQTVPNTESEYIMETPRPERCSVPKQRMFCYKLEIHLQFCRDNVYRRFKNLIKSYKRLNDKD